MTCENVTWLYPNDPDLCGLSGDAAAMWESAPSDQDFTTALATDEAIADPGVGTMSYVTDPTTSCLTDLLIHIITAGDQGAASGGAMRRVHLPTIPIRKIRIRRIHVSGNDTPGGGSG